MMKFKKISLSLGTLLIRLKLVNNKIFINNNKYPFIKTLLLIKIVKL